MAILLQHYLPFKLHRRCQLTSLQGEVYQQNAEFLATDIRIVNTKHYQYTYTVCVCVVSLTTCSISKKLECLQELIIHLAQRVEWSSYGTRIITQLHPHQIPTLQIHHTLPSPQPPPYPSSLLSLTNKYTWTLAALDTDSSLAVHTLLYISRDKAVCNSLLHYGGRQADFLQNRQS